ncbi:MAG: hypothetical protein ACTSVC_02275 [Promethearchaeota archaeon]
MSDRKLFKIQRYLEEKQINYTLKKDKILVPYLINNYKFKIEIFLKGKWLLARTLIIEKEKINETQYLDLIKDLLIANHELPEINYSIERETGNIYSGADMRYNILNFDNFFSEFYAIPYAIKYFIEQIGPNYSIKFKK